MKMRPVEVKCPACGEPIAVPTGPDSTARKDPMVIEFDLSQVRAHAEDHKSGALSR